MDRLAGKTAVITGIGPGIGSAIARAFAREGAALVLGGFANPAFEATTRLLRDSGSRVAVVHGDVGRRALWDQTVETADRGIWPRAYRCQQRGDRPLRPHSRRP